MSWWVYILRCGDGTLYTGTAADVEATAYRTGHFARNKLIFSGEYTLKPADEEALRAAGILLSDALDY